MTREIEQGLIEAYDELLAQGLIYPIDITIRLGQTYDPVTGDVQDGDEETHGLVGAVYDEKQEYRVEEVTKWTDAVCVIISKTQLPFQPEKVTSMYLKRGDLEYEIVSHERYWDDGQTEAWEFGLLGGCQV